MAEYKTIKGFKTQSYASDPVLSGVAGAAWSSGANLGTAVQYAAGAGTLTAGLVISGGDPAKITTTQEYDGSAWANGGAVTNARIDAGSAGTQTSALVTGGTAPPGPTSATEEYDGTSWTAGGALSRGAGRGLCGSCGATQDAAWVAGGRGSPDFNDLMETYNGTTWTETNDLNTGRAYAMGAGTTTAGILFGGMTGDPSLTGNTAATEIWDGTSWSTSPATLNSTRREAGGSGTQTLALCFGGVGPPSNEKKAVAEAFDGTSWTEVADLATARMGGAPSKLGTQTASFYAGGAAAPGVTNATEEFAAGDNLLNEGQIWYNTTGNALKYTTIAAGTWASGGTANNSHNIAYAAGTQTATLIWAGGTSGVSSNSDKTESYNGTAWTELATLGTARRNGGYAGTQTSALCAGGQVPAASTLNESWDGTSWSTESVLTTLTGRGTRAAGTSDSAVLAFGDDSYSAASTLWNGTAWTAQPSMTTARAYSAPIGTSTSAIAAGGYPVSPAEGVNYWDGSTWAEGADVNDGRNYAGACGPNNESGLYFGGDAPGLSSLTEQYNGTAWTEVANLATAREGVQGGGTAVTAIAGGGYAPDQTVSEEWTRPLTVKTVTVS